MYVYSINLNSTYENDILLGTFSNLALAARAINRDIQLVQNSYTNTHIEDVMIDTDAAHYDIFAENNENFLHYSIQRSQIDNIF